VGKGEKIEEHMTMTDAIDSRASVRSFTDEPVSDDELRSLLQAAMAAPSAGNQQPWEFVVAREAGLRSALAAASPYAKPAAAAPVTIVFLMRQEGVRFPVMAPQDLSAAIENTLLRATDLGLGTVWMGIYPEEDRVKAVSAALGADITATPFALVAVGHPAKEPRVTGPSRFDEGRIHWR